MTFTGRFLFVLTFVLAFAIRHAHADKLTTISGQTINGKLVSVDPQGITFSSSEKGEAKVPSKEIYLVDLGNPIAPPPKDSRYHEVELTDGSTLRITKYAIKGKKLIVDLLPGPKDVPMPTYEIDLGSVFSVMRGADDLKNREAWKKLLSNRGKRDLYVIREAEGLNSVSGTILSGNEAGDTLTFEKLDGSTTELRLSRATGGLIFAQPQSTQIAPTLCKVLDVFGNSLIARAIEISSSGATITTVSGGVIKYSNRNALSRLDYAQGNVAYLSDLEPKLEVAGMAADEKGLRVNVDVPFTKDKAISNEPLKLGSEAYAKGLMVAPETRLTFNIGGDYREFKAVIGIQELTLDANLEARLTIEADDGRVLYSDTLKRKDKPRSIGLDVKAVKQLRIIVEADFPVNGNNVILADAKVQK